MQQKINFRQERNFGEIFGVALTFMRQNFKSLFGSLLLLGGPFVVAFSVMYGLVQTKLQGMSAMSMMTESSVSASVFEGLIYFFVGIIFLLIGSLVMTTLVYEYMLLYYEKNFGESITVSEIARRVFRSIWRVLGASFIVFFITFIAAFLLVMMVIGIGQGSLPLAVLLGFLFVIALLLTMPVYVYWISAGMFLVVRDDTNIFDGLGRSRRYLHNNYWWTWLLLFVALLATQVVGTIFSLPAIIVNMVSTFSRVRDISEGTEAGGSPVMAMVFIVLYTIAQLMTMFLRAFVQILSVFQYLNLEEQNEGKGLIERINEIQ